MIIHVAGEVQIRATITEDEYYFASHNNYQLTIDVASPVTVLEQIPYNSFELVKVVETFIFLTQAYMLGQM